MDQQPEEARFEAEQALARPQLHRLVAALRQTAGLLLDTSIDEHSLSEAADAAETLVERLKVTQAANPAARSWARREGRTPETWGLSETSPVAGTFNIAAPPLRMWLEGQEAVATGVFGQQYEGPPGHVHGGIVAAAFDEVLGMVQGITGHAGMTGTLTVRYRRATPLNSEVTFRARVDRVEGRKLFTSATLHAGEQLCAEADGIFIRVQEGHFERLRDAALLRDRES